MTTFSAKSAAILLQQAVNVFNALSDGPGKVRMADAVDTFSEVLPTLIPPGKPTEQFLGYLDFIGKEISAARHLGISATTKIPPPLCLNNKSEASCGGPPEHANYCVVCGKRGGKL